MENQPDGRETPPLGDTPRQLTYRQPPLDPLHPNLSRHNTHTTKPTERQPENTLPESAQVTEAFEKLAQAENSPLADKTKKAIYSIILISLLLAASPFIVTVILNMDTP